MEVLDCIEAQGSSNDNEIFVRPFTKEEIRNAVF